MTPDRIRLAELLERLHGDSRRDALRTARHADDSRVLALLANLEARLPQDNMIREITAANQAGAGEGNSGRPAAAGGTSANRNHSRAKTARRRAASLLTQRDKNCRQTWC